MNASVRCTLRASAAGALLIAAGAALARQEKTEPAPQPPVQEQTGPSNRRVLNGEPVPLAFRNVSVEQLIPFIVEATGKVVMPQQDVLTRKLTIVNDRPIPRQQALDLVFLALQQAGVGVIETGDVITLRDLAEVQKADVPVIGPDESVLDRTDPGTIAEKVFALRHASAENLGTILKDAVPDYAKLTVDKESNQVIVMGNVGLLKRLELLITSLDQPNAAALATETFRLRYADAEMVAANIRELFSTGTTPGQQGQQRGAGGGGGGLADFFRLGPGGGRDGGAGGGGTGGGVGGGGRQGGAGGGQQNRQGGGQQGQRPGGQEAGTATSANLRVTANTQQNSVTVLAERQVLEQIREQIATYWDKELPEGLVVPRVYDLKNSDPIKVRDLLDGLFGKGTTATGTGSQAGQQSVGRLAGQFSFQAIPESNRLVAVSKSPDNMAVIDKIIADIDQPQTAGLPDIVELKHAQAEELAEQLNTLLALDGTLAQIRRSASGLTEGTSTNSPFATQQAQQDTTQQAQTPTSAENIAFWWQRSRPPTDKRGASNLIGTIRIVPVWRQNALMVMAPPEYRSSVVDLIDKLDRPGRQVLISAIVCEMSNADATALGLRWSSQTITPTNADNSLSIGANSETSPFLANLFNSSILNVNMNINFLLQALNEKTGVNILSDPKVFTSDNQEAEFFDGQDIPFVTDSQVNTQGNLTQSFDYRAVGIQLRIRPRITINKDVDLRVNLQLSSIAPGGQATFGGFIVDRRETTTQLILGDGQTVVISGIHRQEWSDIKRKVPFLGDIPLLGLLFRSTEKSLVDKELLVFITPIVVENAEDMEKLNQPYRERKNQMEQNLDEKVRKAVPGRPPPVRQDREPPEFSG